MAAVVVVEALRNPDSCPQQEEIICRCDSVDQLCEVIADLVDDAGEEVEDQVPPDGGCALLLLVAVYRKDGGGFLVGGDKDPREATAEVLRGANHRGLLWPPDLIDLNPSPLQEDPKNGEV